MPTISARKILHQIIREYLRSALSTWPKELCNPKQTTQYHQYQNVKHTYNNVQMQPQKANVYIDSWYLTSTQPRKLYWDETRHQSTNKSLAYCTHYLHQFISDFFWGEGEEAEWTEKRVQTHDETRKERLKENGRPRRPYTQHDEIRASI